MLDLSMIVQVQGIKLVSGDDYKGAQRISRERELLALSLFGSA
jgi:hypothetical protein